MSDSPSHDPSDEPPGLRDKLQGKLEGASELLERAEEGAAQALQAPTENQRAIKAGRMLDRLGQLLFPLGAGALGGFYAADQGLRLIPTMLEICVVVGLCSLGAMAVGRWLAGEAVTETESGLRLRRRVLVGVCLSLVAVLLGLGVHMTRTPSPLTSLPPDTFNQAFVQDSQQYREHDEGMELLLGRLEGSGLDDKAPDEVLSAAEEKLLRESWGALLSYATALDQIRIFYEDYWRFDISRVQRSYHLRAYLLTFAAELALYEKAVRFTDLIKANKNAHKFLDAPHPGLDLPAHTFSRFRQELLGARDQSRVLAGKRYLDWLETGFKARSEAKALGVAWIHGRIERHLNTIETVSPIDRTIHTLKADSQGLKRGVRRVWYPAQKEVAETLGDTRVRRIGWYLIDKPLIDKMDPHLEPGDILLSRKNWYLSNVGLPGFWPHGLLYLGDPDKFARYFDDPEVNAWLAEQQPGGQPTTLSRYLSRRWPSWWRTYTQGQEGHPNRVLEAISEGVVFNTLEHAAGDYLVAVRPRLSKLDKARALIDAFGSLGRPYDFDFDFATDHAVVCTELVWRAYRPDPSQGKGGLDIPLVTVAGRQTLPANELARLFSQQHNTPAQQMDFVYFIDTMEKERKAFVSDEAAFLSTWERPQWDIRQK